MNRPDPLTPAMNAARPWLYGAHLAELATVAALLYCVPGWAGYLAALLSILGAVGEWRFRVATMEDAEKIAKMGLGGGE